MSLLRRNVGVWVVTGLVLLSCVPLLSRWIRQWDRARRAQWPAPIASMQDLPPLDRRGWPATPVAWTATNEEIEAATPAGTKQITVTYQINTLGIKLVRLEPGTFRMGITEREARRLNKPEYITRHYYTAHPVTLTRPYFIGAFEVTNAQFERFDARHAKHRPPYQQEADGDTHPAQPVTWRQANEYCRWLSAKEGRLYRLPTEAEWEYACKAGTETRAYWGDNIWDRNKANLGGEIGKELRQAWSDDGYEFTAPVGTYDANPWGLYDTLGNAFEWVNDWFAPFTAAPAVDPTGPATGHLRVAKGGAWNTTMKRIFYGIRDGDSPQDIKDLRGFRVVCEVE